MLRGAMCFDRSHISVQLINDVTMIVRIVAPNVPTQIAGLCPAMRRQADQKFSQLNAFAWVSNQKSSDLRWHRYRPKLFRVTAGFSSAEVMFGCLFTIFSVLPAALLPAAQLRPDSVQ